MSRVSKIDDFVIQQVKALRIGKGWSQQRLADEMNISKSFVRDIEHPNRIQKWNISHLNTLAILFDCKFSIFFPDEPFE